VDAPGVPLLPRVEARDAIPPLTQELVEPRALYGTILRRYRSALPVVSQLRDALASGGGTLSLEQALATYGQRGNPEIALHLMGFRFYLRDLTIACSEYAESAEFGGPLTHYTRLVTRLHNWAYGGDREACFVSFNYDLLLDRACEAVWGLDPFNLDSYCANERVSLLKPHGSAAWARRIINNGDPIDIRPEQYFDVVTRYMRQWPNDFAKHLDNNVIGDRNAIPQEYLAGQRVHVAVPELALPIIGKPNSLLPPTQRERLASLARRITRVLTIGWRAAEDDFMQSLADVLDPNYKLLCVMGGGNAYDEAQDVGRRFLQARNHLRENLERNNLDGFADFMVKSGEQLEWLLE
jgi:hypothetical protein